MSLVPPPHGHEDDAANAAFIGFAGALLPALTLAVARRARWRRFVAPLITLVLLAGAFIMPLSTGIAGVIISTVLVLPRLFRMVRPQPRLEPFAAGGTSRKMPKCNAGGRWRNVYPDKASAAATGKRPFYCSHGHWHVTSKPRDETFGANVNASKHKR